MGEGEEGRRSHRTNGNGKGEVKDAPKGSEEERLTFALVHKSSGEPTRASE